MRRPELNPAGWQKDSSGASHILAADSKDDQGVGSGTGRLSHPKTNRRICAPCLVVGGNRWTQNIPFWSAMRLSQIC